MREGWGYVSAETPRSTSVMDKLVSQFARKVYDAVLEIPAGRVATYQGIARRIGCKSARAVGQALKVNPFAPTVPCHRVIASDLRLGGFKGCRDGAALTRKQDLLAKEGVRFVEGRLAEPGRIWGMGGEIEIGNRF